MWKEVDQRIRRAMGSVRLAFRAVLSRVNSAPGVQTVQGEGLADEALQGNELMQHYGFTSVPLPGCEGIVVPVGGQTAHGVIIATEHGNYRLKSLKPGEVALYTDEGSKIVLKRGRLIEVDCDVFKVNCQAWEVNASAKADFNTPTLTASAKVVAQGVINGNGGMAIKGGNGVSVMGSMAQTGGSFTTDADVVASGTSLHSHKHNGDSGGVTSAPI